MSEADILFAKSTNCSCALSLISLFEGFILHVPQTDEIFIHNNESRNELRTVARGSHYKKIQRISNEGWGLKADLSEINK